MNARKCDFPFRKMLFVIGEMVFGTWLKQTFNKVKDVAMNKALPAAKKVAGFVGKAASLVLGAIGSAIGYLQEILYQMLVKRFVVLHLLLMHDLIKF